MRAGQRVSKGKPVASPAATTGIDEGSPAPDRIDACLAETGEATGGGEPRVQVGYRPSLPVPSTVQPEVRQIGRAHV